MFDERADVAVAAVAVDVAVDADGMIASVASSDKKGLGGGPSIFMFSIYLPIMPSAFGQTPQRIVDKPL